MNKKLIKTIASITCGLGVATAIPAIASSCGEHGYTFNFQVAQEWTVDISSINFTWNEEQDGIPGHWSSDEIPVKFDFTMTFPEFDNFYEFFQDNTSFGHYYEAEKFSTTILEEQIPADPEFQFSFNSTEIYGDIARYNDGIHGSVIIKFKYTSIGPSDPTDDIKKYTFDTRCVFGLQYIDFGVYTKPRTQNTETVIFHHEKQ